LIGAYASLLLILGAALLVGQALVALACGASRERRVEVSWVAPPVGLAALLVLAGIAIRLPGHGVAAAVALAVAAVVALDYLRGRVSGLGLALSLALPVLAITVLVVSLPFLIAGNVGILGAGLVNDDMASHLIIADYIADPAGVVPSFIRGGYPAGPHALVAAIAEPTGFGLVEAFAGLSLAIASLLALTGLGLLRGLGPVRRTIGACLIALPYLAAAYLAQGAFKEPLMALLLIGFALCLAELAGLRDGPEEEPSSRAHPALRVVPLGVLVAGVVFAYSLPGLLWVGAIAVALCGTRLLLVKPRPQLPEDWPRRLAPYALGGLAVAVALTAFEWERISSFTRLEALNPDRFGSQLGNLAQSLNPLEALGIWPSGEFDATATSAGLPAIVFYLGAALALAAFAVGLIAAVRERRYALPVAALASLVAWGVLVIAGSPYVAAKGLAIAAPLVIAVSLRGTLGGRSPALALGVALVLGGCLSTFLIMRSAAVGPEAHAAQLEAIREVVEDEGVLFLGRDDFIGWELRGSGTITGVVTNFYDVEDAKPRFKRGEGGGEKFDVDVLFPRQLDRFRYVLATRGGPASEVPPRFEVAAKTSDYVLYERTGAIGKRSTLDEGTAPGAVNDCEGREAELFEETASGTAVVWDPEPVIADAEGWAPEAEASDGSPASQVLEIPSAGRWLISLAYDSRRPLRVTSPGLDLETTVAANLDFRGATPTFPVAEVEVDGPQAAEVTVEPEEPNLLGRLLRAPNEAHLTLLTATPLDPGAIRQVPLAETCGRYVDWYRADNPTELAGSQKGGE